MNKITEYTGGVSVSEIFRGGYNYFEGETKQHIPYDNWLYSNATVADYARKFELTISDSRELDCLDFMGRGLDPEGLFKTMTSVSLSGGHNHGNPNPSTELIGSAFRTKVWRQLNAEAVKKGGFDVIFYVPQGGHYLSDSAIHTQEEFNKMLGLLLVRFRILEKLQKLLTHNGHIYAQLPIMGFDARELDDKPHAGSQWEVLKYLYDGIEIDSQVPYIDDVITKSGCIRQGIDTLELREVIWRYVNQKLKYMHGRLRYLPKGS